MRPFGMLLGLVVIPALLAAEQAGTVLSPAEATKKVNEKVTVEMEVKSVGNKDNWFLNSESDYKSDKNFTVFIPKEVVEKFKKNKIEDPEAQFKGKTIQVTGTVILYEKKPEIKVAEPDQIKIVTKK
jgi:DNA/RNA endonuclease YhcR with UshA esterase domain